MQTVNKILSLVILGFALSSSHALAYSKAHFDSVTTPEEANINQVREQEIAQIKIVLGRRFQETETPRHSTSLG